MQGPRVEQVTGVPGVVALVLDSGAPGPTAAFTANLHGDECTGTGAVFELVRALPAALLRGRVALYPSLNPEGLAAASRPFPQDEADLNRLFPGSRGGPASEQHARALWDDLLRRSPDLVVDLHTDAAGAIPYALVDRVLRGPDALAARCEALAAATGLTVVHEYPSDRYRRYSLDRSLPGALVNGPGIAAVTLEIGPRRLIDPSAVGEMVQAALGVLTAAGMVESPAPTHPTRRGGGPWRRESGPRIRATGVLVPRVAPGAAFEARGVLAEVIGLDGVVRETLTAPWPGFVLALPERAWVTPGLACGTVAIAER